MTSVETELVIPAALMEAGEADHHDRLAEPFVEEHPPVAAASSSSGAQDPEEAARAQDKTKNLLIGMALPESDIFPAPAEGTEKARVMIVTIGTRGDIQPFLALGAALQRAGYLVLMLSHGVFGDSIRQGGLHFTPLEGDPGQIMGSPEFRHAFYEGGIMEQIKIFTTGMEEALDQNMRILARAAEELRADCILYSVTTLVDAVAVGVKLGIPTYYVSTIPFQNTSEFPPVAAMASPFALGFMNSMMHSLVWKIGWTMFDKRVNRFRKELGLPEWTKYDPVGYPGTCIYSPLIQPKPRDWAEHDHVTGYCILPSADYAPPRELAEFLEAGSPPVYMGFGSMPVRDSVELVDAFRTVLRNLGLRGLFCGGWTDIPQSLAAPSEAFLMIKGAPHEWLFPRCLLAIHHGGAGTTAASVRAGIPTLIFPVLGDQPYWAHRMAVLGVGPRETVPLREFSQNALSRQISAANTPAVIAAARALGEAVRAEDGIANFVAWFEAAYQADRSPRVSFNWVPDAAASQCAACRAPFSIFLWRKHCRSCGTIFCGKCLAKASVPSNPGFQNACASCISVRHLRLARGSRLPPSTPASASASASTPLLTHCDGDTAVLAEEDSSASHHHHDHQQEPQLE